MARETINRDKQGFAIGLIGGPTMVIDYGRLRLVTDPTFDPPTAPGGRLTKLEAPAVTAEELGEVDLVLLSHDAHGDNFDQAGRTFASTARQIITGLHTAPNLTGHATGLEPWQSTTVESPTGARVKVEVVPASHGPLDGQRDEWGNVNCEVVGFIVSSADLPTIYVSGDNASIAPVAQVAARHPSVDIAILFAGAARVADKERGRPLTLTADRAADAAILLGAGQVVPAHFRGWGHFSEGAEDLRVAFDEAGIAERLTVPEPGVWAVREV